jgi:TetR/AcrR family transcriptional regulator, repressor for neighboring sulfatase
MRAGYKKEQAPRRRKRVGDEARDEGLAAARDLLLTGGPGAVTLANVGRQIGMSHTNVIHHFGSAAGLQSALMGKMIKDLTLALDELVAKVRSDSAAPTQIVEQVFDAFDKGGAGQLAAWIALSGEKQHLAPVRDAVRELVAAFSERIPGYESRIRSAVLMISICAFGDAVIGEDIRAMLDEPDRAMRDITTRLLGMFLIP